jgi:serine/threonine protein phosphatase 1
MTVQPNDLLLPKKGRIDERGRHGFKRLVAIGDIHGCVVELANLLTEIQLAPTDLLVFLGDLQDRGPASGTVVSFVREMCETREGTAFVLGNHDEKHVRARRHMLNQRAQPGYKIPMHLKDDFLVVNQQFTDEDCAWMAGLPVAVVLNNPSGPRPLQQTVLTHAGVHPERFLSMPASALIRLCYLDESQNPTPHIYVDGVSCAPPGAKHWSELYNHEDRIVYGHAVLSQDMPVVRNNTYAVDTGCVFGGYLTAYIEDLDTGEVNYARVRAAENYANIESLNAGFEHIKVGHGQD